VLLVLDQFEQWLHARRGEENTELVGALRHCDGEHVQAIVLVRDDFWMATTRFLSGLEIRLLEGENSAAVDLFDPRHAKKVLTTFGRAYGALPDHIGDVSSEQESFLNQSISGLAQDGKIISVRLALFAEVMKGKLWTPATLTEVGGTQGVGLTFLEETFSASTAPPEHRFHQKAAQAVLKALLPDSAADIKGQMRSRLELLEASGYASRPSHFDDLIRILDAELRLITPTDSEGITSEVQQIRASGQYYQLTHDYLVHSLRDWLTRKQRQTRRGRAEIRLAEVAKSWDANPRRQSLPTFSEWLSILAFTKRGKWSALERRMLRAAARKQRAGLLSALFIIALSCVLPVIGSQYVRATLLADQFQTEVGDKISIISNMNSCRFWIDPILKSKLADAKKNNDTQWILQYSAALVPTHPDICNNLYSQILPERFESIGYGTYYRTSSGSELAWTILQKHDPGFSTRMWEIAADKGRVIWQRYFAAEKLIEIDPSNARWSELAPDLIAAHDFASDPSLAFRAPWLQEFRTGAELKKHFREALLRKIDQCHESSCPWNLLLNFFTPKEALDLMAGGYLSGHFSLDSMKQFAFIPFGTIHVSDLKERFVTKSGNSDRERRRELALYWLTENPWATR
jgi:hypothetical protein